MFSFADELNSVGCRLSQEEAQRVISLIHAGMFRDPAFSNPDRILVRPVVSTLFASAVCFGLGIEGTDENCTMVLQRLLNLRKNKGLFTSSRRNGKDLLTD